MKLKPRRVTYMRKIIDWFRRHFCAAWLMVVSLVMIAACGLAMGGAAETDASVLNPAMHAVNFPLMDEVE